MMPSLRLVFVERYPEADVGPTAYVYVERSECAPYAPTCHDKLVLTHPTTTWGGFRQELNRLCGELEELRREAELRFANFTAKRYEPRAPTTNQHTGQNLTMRLWINENSSDGAFKGGYTNSRLK